MQSAGVRLLLGLDGAIAGIGVLGKSGAAAVGALVGLGVVTGVEMLGLAVVAGVEMTVAISVGLAV